jgi:thiamine-phosphate pyrophosphorylase
MPFDVARRLLPDNMAIGLSAETLDDVQKAQSLDLDYLAISPVFHTLTKADIGTMFGWDGFSKARYISRHKLVAIGGVTPENASELRMRGADGLAVVSAICRSENPYEAAKALAP